MIEFGVHEDPTAGGRTPAQVKAKYPRAVWGRAFVSGEQTTVVDLRPKFEQLYQPYLDAGLKVYVSVKTNVTATRNGTWNSRFTELGNHLQSIADKVRVIWWHEPEDDMDGQAFVHAFNKVRERIKMGGGDVQVGMASMTYQWAPNWNNTASIGGKTDDPAEWMSYQGNPLNPDFLAADVYSGRSFDLEHTLGTHPGYQRWLTAFATPLMTAKGSDIPIILTERGFETPSATNQTNRSALRVSTIESEFDYLAQASEPITGYIFWSSPGTENAPGLVMDTAAENAILAGMDELSTEDPEPEPDPEPDPCENCPPPTDCNEQAALAYQQGYDAGYAAAFAAGQAAGRQSYKDDFIAGMPAV